MRALPDIDVVVPCDSIEAKKATIAAGKTKKPVYLRFTRDKTPVMTTDETPFDQTIQTFWVSDSPQVTIFATGYMTYYALLAAKELEEEKIPVLVANVANIKPLDVKTVVQLMRKTGAAVSVEDHQVMGGLGGAIAETLALHYPAPQEFIGLQNTFAESGQPQELRDKYGMGINDIKEAVKKAIARKKK